MNTPKQQGDSDTLPVFESTEAAPSAPAGDNPNGAPSNDEPQYLTLADVQALLNQQAQQFQRQIQSATAKAENRIANRFSQRNDAYQQAADLAVKNGFVAADKKDAYAAMLRQNAFEGALLPDTPGGQPAGQPQQPQEPAADDQEPDVEAVNQRAAQLYQQFALTANDPEAAGIITDQGPSEFIASIMVAGRLKAKRLGQQPAPSNPRQTAARIPNLGNGNGKAPPKNPIANKGSQELYDLEWQEMRQSAKR